LKLLPDKPGDLCLVLPEETRAWARKELEPLRPAKIVHVHPVARWLRKCWNDDSMARVIDWLQLERGARVVVTTGPIPRERERAQSIVGRCKTRPLFFDGTCTLTQLGAITAESDCFLGVDTAPMHIAAAVGKPVIALFGPTGADEWRPWRARGKTLRHPCLCRGKVQKPCDPDPNVPRLCMEAITVEEVQAALDEFLVS
jgi:ADP-heptose:LPS heptosyltransferase